MALTLIGPTATSSPPHEAAMLIRVAETPAGPWQAAGSLWTLDGGEIRLPEEGFSVLRFSNPYGTIKLPEEIAWAGTPRGPVQLIGSWVQLLRVAEDGISVQFVGRVFAEERMIMGSDPEQAGGERVNRGRQTWTAYGGEALLARRCVRESVHLVQVGDGFEARRVGWSPSFNRRDRRGFVSGNRSASAVTWNDLPTPTETYCFGGRDLWTRRQALDYVLTHFAFNEADQLQWTVGGQTELLDYDLEDLRQVRVGETQTVLELIGRLIPRQLGCSWRVVPRFGDEEVLLGFEVQVFSLLPQEVSFRNATLPRNREQLTITVGETVDLIECRVSRDASQQAQTVRLVGERIVVCATLWGPEAGGIGLREGWTSAQETAYKAGAAPAIPADEAEELHDAARQADRFRAVYQRYTAPRPWPLSVYLSPQVDGSGELLPSAASIQELDRETLSWTPLREGTDYTQDPPVGQHADEDEPDLRPPLVVGSNAAAEEQIDDAIEAAQGAHGTGWETAVAALQAAKSRGLASSLDRLGVNVAALKDDVGVQLTASPNHKLARGRFDPEASGVSATAVDPADGVSVRPGSISATVAWRADSRLVLASEAPSGDGSEIEVEAEGAELWVLMPQTLVDADGTQLKLSPDTRMVLRNDSDRLALRMCGLIARHLIPRARAVLVFRGIKPWATLLGQILVALDDAGDTHQIQGAVTAVKFHGGQEPRTVIEAGFSGVR